MSHIDARTITDRCASSPGLSSRWSDAVSAKLLPLNGGMLCAGAQRRTKLRDFGDPTIELRLGILVKCLEREGDLHLLGRLLARIHLHGILRTRLLLEDAWKHCVGWDTEPIRRPIFITGMPRSGSTFLHELLAQDQDNRTPRAYEVMSPVEIGVQRQIRHTARCLWWFRKIAREADSVHPIRATTPQECIAIHSYTFLSRSFTAIFRVPAYEAFLNAIDFEPAYAWQKRFLQHLQWRSPQRRWILKAPDHVYSLDELLRVFPDAVIIQTHRDPLEVLESATRLTEVLQRIFARPQPRRQIGIREASGLADGLDRITRFREAHPELAHRFLDVNYDDLIRDPVKIVSRLYRELDLPLTCAATERIRSLAALRSRYSGDKSTGKLADFGVDPETRELLASHVARLATVRLERGGA